MGSVARFARRARPKTARAPPAGGAISSASPPGGPSAPSLHFNKMVELRRNLPISIALAVAPFCVALVALAAFCGEKSADDSAPFADPKSVSPPAAPAKSIELTYEPWELVST